MWLFFSPAHSLFISFSSLSFILCQSRAPSRYLRQTAVFFCFLQSFLFSLSCLLLLSTYHSLPRLASLLRRGFRANRIASSLGPSVTHGASVTVPESANEGYSATVNAISTVIPDAYSRDLKLGTRSVFSTVSFQLPTLDDTSHHESTTKRWRYFRHLHSCWGRLS